ASGAAGASARIPRPTGSRGRCIRPPRSPPARRARQHNSCAARVVESAGVGIERGMQISPFRIAVPGAVLSNLHARLAPTRLPAETPGSGWTYGTNPAYLHELVTYWRERYDWRAAEARLNRFLHFRARVGDLGIHFIHERGVGPAPLPLIITHG